MTNKIPRPSPIKQIRKSCLECSGNQVKQVMFCQITTCALWYLRFGVYPQRKVKEDKRYEKLFDPKNFEEGAVFGPERDAEELTL